MTDPVSTGTSCAPLHWRRDFALVLIFDTFIAVLFAAIMRGGLVRSFIFSQAIGVSIFTATHLLMRLRGVTKPTPGIMPIAVSVGAITGTAIGYLIVWLVYGTVQMEEGLLPGSLLGALIFGVAISYFFYSRHTLEETQTRLRLNEVERVNAGKRLAEAELKALQAQIEPHFLFNTLSNVASLIETDPATAKRMLVNFTAYLRGSLERTRTGRTTLGQELELVRRYLEIMAIRMGDRLQWSVTADADVDAIAFPPLILQPFVENAIQHGIGPLTQGGRVCVTVRRDSDAVTLEVTDDGRGFEGRSASGVGIENVRQRLQTLYDGRAELSIRAHTPSGVRVAVRVPVAEAAT